MSKNIENKELESVDVDRYDPDKVRLKALAALEEIETAPLDMGRLTDPAYLATLSPAQLAKIKKVTTDRNGAIVSVEMWGMVELIRAKTDIAGVKVKTATEAKQKLAAADAEAKQKLALATAEAKAKAEAKKKALEKQEEKSRIRSNKLILSVKSDEDKQKTGNEDTKTAPAKSKKTTLTEVMNAAGAKK